MHLSMLIPRVGGGGGGPTQGNLTFSREPESNNPNPWAPRKFQIPTPRYRFFPKTVRSYVKFPTPGQNPNVKIPTQEKVRAVNFPRVGHPPPPPTLGLNIDRCINPSFIYHAPSWFQFCSRSIVVSVLFYKRKKNQIKNQFRNNRKLTQILLVSVSF